MKLRMRLLQQAMKPESIASNDFELAGAMLKPKDLEVFALAGNATFTIMNVQTGNRFTYKVRQCDNDKSLYFVSVLTGPDNMVSYTYMGTIRPGSTGLATWQWQYAHGRKSTITEEAMSNQAFAWVWFHRRNLPAYVEVWHEGRCGRCGRALTVPESIASGFGPECQKKVA